MTPFSRLSAHLSRWLNRWGFGETHPTTRSFELYRGAELLGTIELRAEHCDFPWYGGEFRSEPAFAALEPLFAEEIALIDREEMDAWGEVWRQIEGPGLRLVPVGGGEPWVDPMIHIVDGVARWRT